MKQLSLAQAKRNLESIEAKIAALEKAKQEAIEAIHGAHIEKGHIQEWINKHKPLSAKAREIVWCLRRGGQLRSECFNFKRGDRYIISDPDGTETQIRGMVFHALLDAQMFSAIHPGKNGWTWEYQLSEYGKTRDIGPLEGEADVQAAL